MQQLLIMIKWLVENLYNLKMVIKCCTVFQREGAWQESDNVNPFENLTPYSCEKLSLTGVRILNGNK